MEKGQDTQHPVTSAVRPSERFKMLSIQRVVLQQIRHDIVMRQAHTLGQAGRPRGINQEGQVLLRPDLGLRIPVSTGKGRPLHARPMPRLPFWIRPLPQQNDPLLGYAGPRRRLPRPRQELQLRDQGPRPGVGQLESQLLDRVQRVGRAGDAPGPEHAARHGGGVDVVGRVEREHVAGPPAPERLQASAEADGGDAQLRVCVAARRALAVGQDLLGAREGLGPAATE